MSATVGKIQRTGAGAFSAYLAASIKEDAERRVGAYYASKNDVQRTAWRVLGRDAVADRLGVVGGDRLDRDVLERMIAGRDTAGHRLLDPTPQMLARLGRELGRDVTSEDLAEWHGLFVGGLSHQLHDIFSSAQVQAIDVALAGGSLGKGGTRAKLNFLGQLVGHDLSMADVVAMQREGGEFAREVAAVLASTEPKGAEVAAFDLTFSAPKSVSVLWAMAAGTAEQAELAAALERAHFEASAQALAWVAKEMRVRRGKDGAELLGADGLVAAQVLQTMSRDQDPHLHTHTVISTAVVGEDGRVTRLDSQQMYHASQLAGRVYHLVLREKLAEVAPLLRWRELGDGLAELASVPTNLTDLMSKRSKAIQHDLESLAKEGRRLQDLMAKHPEKYQAAVKNVAELGEAASPEDKRLARDVERAAKWSEAQSNKRGAKNLSWARTRASKEEPDERDLCASVLLQAGALGVTLDGLLANAAQVELDSATFDVRLRERAAEMLSMWMDSGEKHEMPLAAFARGGRGDVVLAGAKALLADVVPEAAGSDALRRAGVQLQSLLGPEGDLSALVTRGFVARFGAEDGAARASAWWSEFSNHADEEWVNTSDLDGIAKAAADGLAREASIFNERELFQRVVDLLGAGKGVTVARAEEAMDKAREYAALIEEGRHASSWVRRDEAAVFTTESMVREELRMQDRWQKMAKREDWLPADVDVVSRVAEERTLTDEQRDFLAAATLTGSQLLAVEGVAGAGKSWVLGAVADVMRAQGVFTVGLATSAQAAQNLAIGSGFSSASSLAKFLINAEQGRIVVGLPEELDRKRSAIEADQRALNAWKRNGEHFWTGQGQGDARNYGESASAFQSDLKARMQVMDARREQLTAEIEAHEVRSEAHLAEAHMKLSEAGRVRAVARHAVARARTSEEKREADSRLRAAEARYGEAQDAKREAQMSVGQSISLDEARGKVSLVLDEAAMTSGIDMGSLTAFALEHDMQLLAVGDSGQLQAIDRSGFSLMTSAIGAVELNQTVRANAEWERDAQVAMRSAKDWESAGAVVETYLEHGRIDIIDYERVVDAWPELAEATNTSAGKSELAVQTAAKRWEEAVIGEGERDVLLVAPNLRVMSRMNEAVQAKVRDTQAARDELARVERRLERLEDRDGRTLSKEEKQLRDELRAQADGLAEKIGAAPKVDFDKALDLGTRRGKAEQTTLHAGEPVVVLANQDNGLRNGTKGRVEDIQQLADGRFEVSISAPLGADGRWATRSVFVEPGEDAGSVLSLGYAQNVHKAQGATHEVTIAVADSKATQEQVYVALSRGKKENSLIFIADDDERDAKLQIVDAFANSQRKETAVERLLDGDEKRADDVLRRAMGSDSDWASQYTSNVASSLREQQARTAARLLVRQKESRSLLDDAVARRAEELQEEERKARRGQDRGQGIGLAQARRL